MVARPAGEAEEEIMDVSVFWRLAPYGLTEAVRFADAAGRTEVRKVAGAVFRNMYPDADPVLWARVVAVEAEALYKGRLCSA